MHVCENIVYYWADGTWCYESEFNEAEFSFKSDDYGKLDVTLCDSESQIDLLVDSLVGGS